MGKKYSIVKEDKIELNGHTLYRIKAERDIDENTKKGELGGYIESEENLSQEDDSSFVYDNAKVYGNSRLSGDAMASDNAQVKNIVADNAYFSENCIVCSDSPFFVFGEVDFGGSARVHFRHGEKFEFVGGSSFSGDVVAFIEEDGYIDVSTSEIQNDLFNFYCEE